MNNYKNNHRRNRFKSNGDRNFRKRNGNGQKINGDFNNNLDFKRRNPGRNNQNASKLVDKSQLMSKLLSVGSVICGLASTEFMIILLFTPQPL